MTIRRLVVLFSLAALSTVHAADAPENWLEAGFSFDWTKAGTPVPVVEQCATLPITWSRVEGGQAPGPNPTAPYILQIYTSTFITPLTVDAGSGQSFDFPVPFVPDTQFQICMFDKVGVPGGCQRVMTVIPNSENSNPTCRNLTYPRPEQQLQVTALDQTGPMSQFGWPSQCSDISLIPTSGKPPYTLTVAPALHPPYNFTSNATNVPINWTISLTWASPFFVSIVDADGNAWANGPLHSGRGKSNLCLSSQQEEHEDSGVSTAIVAGASVASAVGGILLGLLGAFLFYRSRRNNDDNRIERRPSHSSLLGHDPMSSPHPSPALLGGPTTQYHVEPYVPGGSTGRVRGRQNSMSDGGLSSPPHTATLSEGSSSNRAGGGHVYVVHHDGGRAPVTVYTQDGTEVVELPPRYTGDSSAQSGAAPGRAESTRRVSGPRKRLQVNEPRRPGAAQKSEARLDPPRLSPLTPNRLGEVPNSPPPEQPLD